MAKDRSPPSFSVEIRNGRKREPLNRKWPDGLTPKVSKRTRDEDSSAPSVAQDTRTHAAACSAMDGLLGMAVKPTLPPKGRVLPDLSSLSENATNSEGNYPELAVKPKRRYRQKALSASPVTFEAVDNGVRPHPALDQNEAHFAPENPALPVHSNSDRDAIAEPVKPPPETRRKTAPSDDERLRPGERWKRRLSKYSR